MNYSEYKDKQFILNLRLYIALGIVISKSGIVLVFYSVNGKIETILFSEVDWVVETI